MSATTNPSQQLSVWSRVSAPLDATKTGILICSILLLTIAGISGCSTAPPKPNIEHMLANAKSASDHEAIAQYYQEEAEDAGVKYEEHRASAIHYENSAKYGSWARHCDYLAQDFKQAEQDASVLAAQHRRIAQEIRAGNEAAPASAAPDTSGKASP